MDIRITPTRLSGTLSAIPSKSMAHRLLICAALAVEPTDIACPLTSQDIDATARCLSAMGAEITWENGLFHAVPGALRRNCILDVGESGSTLRFLLPLVAALGLDAEFIMHGRLPQRPLAPLDSLLKAHGITLTHPAPDRLKVTGRLQPGAFTLPGNVSSQYISGMLFAAPFLSGESALEITGSLSSAPYVTMTQAALRQFGVPDSGSAPHYSLTPCTLHSPGTTFVEGDWSNAAFWLAASEMGNAVTVEGLDENSLQGDRVCAFWLPRLGGNCQIDADNIPDLVPILAVCAAAKEGATYFLNAGRLRLKESDRIETVLELIHALGGKAKADYDSLTVYGAPLLGGTVDAHGDHRIAMAAAIAATVCKEPVTILGADAVCKSYPHFWQDYTALGGIWKEETA